MGREKGAGAAKHIGVHTSHLSFQTEDLHAGAVRHKDRGIMPIQRDCRLTLHAVTSKAVITSSNSLMS